MTRYGISLLVLLAHLALAVLLGRQLCRRLPRRLQPMGRLYFSPALGLAVLVLVATLHGWVRPFGFMSAWLAILPLAGAALWLEKDKRGLLRSFLPLLLFTLVVSLPAFLPLILFDAFNPFHDAFTYLAHGQWLQSHSFWERAVPSGFSPAWSQVVLYQREGHRMGGSFFLGWSQAAFGLKWSYDAYPAVIATPLVAGALAVGGAVRGMARGFRRLSWGMAAAAGTMVNGATYSLMLGFLPQAFGLAFSVAGVSLVGALAQQPLEGKSAGRLALWAAPAALLLAALAVAYNDMLPFLTAGMGLFLFLCMMKAERGRRRGLLLLALFLVLESVTLVNAEMVRIVRNFLGTLVTVGKGDFLIGWPVPIGPFEFLAHALGLKPPISRYWLLYSPYATYPVIALALAGIAVFLGAKKSRGSWSAWAPACMILSLVCGFLYFRYVTPAPRVGEQGNTFLQLKLAHWSSPFWFVLAGAALAGQARRFRRAARALPAAFLLLLLVSLAAEAKIAQRFTVPFLNDTGFARDGFSGLLKLRELVKDLPPEEPLYLNLRFYRHKLRQMVGYVLNDRKLASDYGDDGYIHPQMPPEEVSYPFEKCGWVVDFAEGAPETEGARRAGRLMVRPRPAFLTQLVSVTDDGEREVKYRDAVFFIPGAATVKFEVRGALPKAGLALEYRSPSGAIVRTKGGENFSCPPANDWAPCRTPPAVVRETEMSFRLACGTPAADPSAPCMEARRIRLEEVLP